MCFRVMLLLRIKSMNDKGHVPRLQGKGQNEYKRVIRLAMKVFFKIIFKRVWRVTAGKESIFS